MSQLHKRLEVMLDDAFGLCIREALHDRSTTELCVNPDGTIWQEKAGENMRCIGSLSRTNIESIIRLAANFNGPEHEVRPTNPTVAVLLPGGQRFQGFIPPQVDAPAFCIRCPRTQVLSKDDYVPVSCSEDIWNEVTRYVKEQKNILIVGAMSSGKTALLNTLLTYIPKEERLIYLEDTPEIVSPVPNSLRLYTIGNWKKDLLRTAASRIVHGEVRDGPAAMAMLDAWDLGHAGGLCTLHANSAQGALTRLEHLCARVNAEGDFRSQIGDVIDVVIYMERQNDHRIIKTVLTLNTWTGTKYEFKSLLEANPSPSNFGGLSE